MKTKFRASSLSVCLVVLVCACPGGLEARPARLEYRPGPALTEAEAAPRALSASGRMRMRTLGASERSVGRHMRTLPGGGDVSDLFTVQVAFSDPVDGNVVAIFYDEPTPNAAGVRVLIDGLLLGVVPNGQGAPGVAISGFIPGPAVIRVEGANGTFSETVQVVLADLPFALPTNLSCRQGIVTDTSCELVGEWENAGPLPDRYIVFLNGQNLGAVPGDALDVGINGIAAGDYSLALVPFTPSATGNYSGPTIQTSCSVACTKLAPALGVVGFCLLACTGMGSAMMLMLRRRKPLAAA